MKTLVINGVECRMLGMDEKRMLGDYFADGVKWSKFYSRTQRDGGLPCYRPIKRATKPKSKATGIEAAVCADIAERQKKGIAKYGTTVAENPLTDLAWIRHAYEEATDLAVYLRKIIANMEAKGK